MKHLRAGRRVLLLITAVLAALAAPGVAQAHHTAVPIVALDYRNRVEPGPPGLAGVRASLEDAGRKLRLTVDPQHRVLVTGYLGEPFLRFTASGVAANGRSATAQGLRLVPSRRVAGRASLALWLPLSTSHSLSWADSRAWAPSSVLANRAVVDWSVPLVVDGRRAAVTGELIRVPHPVFWPWVVLGALLVLLAVGTGRRKRWSWPVAVGLAAAAGLATAANMTGFALGGLPVSNDRWTLFAVELLLVLVAIALLTRPGARFGAVAALAAFCVLQGLAELAVFRHGVVVSALPGAAVRLAVAIGLGAGLGAAGLLFAVPTGSARRRARGRNPKHPSLSRRF